MTARELRHHLDLIHGHRTVGWTFDQLHQVHDQFHEALAGTDTHDHVVADHEGGLP